jgi:hypothetical protein
LVLPALRGVAHEANVELEVVHVGAYPEESPASYGVAEGCQEAGKHCHPVGFGVRLDLGDDIARQPPQCFLREFGAGRRAG